MTTPQSTQVRLARAASLAAMDCPSCSETGTLTELLPGAGPGSVFRDGQVNKPVLHCSNCGYQSAEDVATRAQGADVSAQVAACLREDAAKGTPGGGSGNARVKRQPKPGDKRETRPEQEPTFGRQREQAKVERIESKTERLEFYLACHEKLFLDRTAEESGLTRTAMVERALADWVDEKAELQRRARPTGARAYQLCTPGQKAYLQRQACLLDCDLTTLVRSVLDWWIAKNCPYSAPQWFEEA